MKLEAYDDPALDQLPRLPRSHHALMRVDAGEGDHDVAVFARGVDHLRVGNAAVADLELRVDREHHEADLALAIVAQRFGDRRTLADLEILARRFLVRRPHDVHGLPARNLGGGVAV